MRHIQGFDGKPERNRPLERPRRRCKNYINRLKPNDPYIGRTVPLTSKRGIFYIYSTNVGTEYFKHALYVFFSSKCSLFHNANLFGPCIIHILYTRCAEIKRIMGRTAPLTSKRCILYIYSTNIGTEYFKRALYSPFFSLQSAVCFIMLTCLFPALFTFYIQGVLKLKK